MTPLTHTVRFVHDEQAHGAREQPVEELAVLEAFRSEIENLPFAVEHLSRRLARFTRREMRVHRERRHAMRLELVLLVLHQRDERTHDDREAGQQQSGKLIDDGLATSGGHHDERVATAEHRAYRLPLTTAKICMPEALAKRGARAGL